MYKASEVEKAALEYFKGDSLAANVWIDKYALKKDGEYLELTPDDMYKRLAKEFARIEEKYPNSISYEEIYNLLKEQIILPGGSLLYGIGNNYAVTSLGNCFSWNTNIITNEGIKPIGSLENSNPILYSQDGRWIESEVKSFGQQELVKLTLIRNDKEKVIETTANHIWYAKKDRHLKYQEILTKDLKEEYVLKYNLSKNYSNYKPSPFGVAHGFYTGDGDKSGNQRIGKRILILEHDKELLPYFSAIQYEEDIKQVHIGSLPNYFKTLPSLDENVSYLYGWLAGYFAADGCIDERGSIVISSVEKKNLQWVKEVCSVLGIGTYDIFSQDRISNLTNTPSTIYGIRLMGSTLNKSFFVKKVDRDRFKENMRKSYWRVKSIEYTGIMDTVYCAIVPETNNFTLEDNILTHNCFVIGNKSDSYGGICTTDQEQAQLMKRRAGVGHDISHLRPANSKVTNAAGTSTGASSFMHRYSNTTREVAQNGRRGALMLTMDINHPDIKDFITAKDDLTKVTGANISVKVDDGFMANIEISEGLPEITKNDKDVLLWKKLVHQAWKSAEPGILFWDKITMESPADCYEGFKSTSTNPCVSADTKILTSIGYVNIESCIGREVDVWNGEEFSRVTPKVTGKTDKWYIIKFSDGSELKCTPHHKFYLKGYENDTFEAQDLKVGNKLQKYSFPVIEGEVKEDLYTRGFYCGDGSNKRGEAIIDLYGIKKELVEYLFYRAEAVNGTNVKRLYLGRDFETDKDFVPLQGYSVSSRLSYLAGLIDSDGSLNDKSGSLNISSVNIEFLTNIKYLLNTLGATGTISLMKEAQMKKLPDGNGGLKEYQTKDCHKIVISATNVKKLMDIGLNTHRVNLIANPDRDASRYITVTDIQTVNVSNELTYCFTEPKSHKGVFNGVLTGQCGEIPLCPYDSCRLLSINLTKIVDNPFTDKAKINWGKLKDYAYKAQKLMDDVVDLEEEKINKILEKIENDPEPEEIKAIEKNLWIKIKSKLLEGRRTGLSGIGLADTLAACNISYSNGITLAEEIYKQLAISAYKSSIDMAKDRGAFPIYNYYKEKNNPFINRLFNTEKEHTGTSLYLTQMRKNMTEKYGRRNIALLTVPPSGTISLLAGISSGIEPVYQLSYKRRRKVDKEHPNVSFVDKNGDCWEEYVVFHSKFKEWLVLNTFKGVEQSDDFLERISDEFYMHEVIKESPYYKSTAYELNPLDRVKMQGAIQKWVDHSISSTINLPKEATEEDVNNIYLTAWKEGLKGVTIYREGSRDGVLISNEDKKEVFNQTTAPKRPKVLRGQVFTPTTHGNDYIVVVGLYDDKPYEVFAAKNNWNLKGTLECDIIKKARGKYDVNVKDKLYIEDITSEMSQIEEDRTRLISVSLRHGADIKFLVEQLNKAKGNGFQDFSKVVARTLKRYIKDNDKVTGATCENCGSTDLIYKDGCVECSSCGSSKCG